MASKESHDQKDSQGRQASSFELRFQKLSSKIEYFKMCFKDSQAILKELKEAFKDEDVSKAFMTQKEEQKLEAHLAKKSTILVVGQTNSGKSSFLNELLGGPYLPTAQEPCTSRIVRLKYSEQNYIQLLDKKGNKVGEPRIFTQKSIPKEEIDLDDTMRASQEWVEQMVEVGIDNSLLQNGHLEFVDAPGMNENETLEAIVRECLDGILQVIIYVIDGNSSLRVEEQEFLSNLKGKMQHLPIFFVCNKVEKDEEAAKYDRDSDDEDDHLHHQNLCHILLLEETIRTAAKEKAQLSYGKLVNNGLGKDVGLEECDVYHGVSTEEVRKARVCGVKNYYVEEFEKMENKILKFAESSISTQLQFVANQLSQIQQRVFNVVLSRGLKGEDPQKFQKILDELTSKEEEYVSKLRTWLQEDESGMSEKISLAIQGEREEITKAAEIMEFSPIKIDDHVRRNEVVHQYRSQIEARVVREVMEICIKTITESLHAVTQTLRTSLRKSFDEISQQGDLLSKQVKNQLLSYVLVSARQPTEVLWQCHYSKMIFHHKYQKTPYTIMTEVFSSVFIGGTMIDKQWKSKVAKETINLVDYRNISKGILTGLRADIDEAHDAFVANVRSVRRLFNARKQCTDLVVEKSPSFAEQMCKTQALFQSLSSPRVQLGRKIKAGHRGVVYQCNVDSDGVAKQLYTNERSSSSQYLAVQSALRIQEDRESVLKPLSLHLDDQNHVTILLPKMDADLHDALQSDRVKGMALRTSLAVVLQVFDACTFSRRFGLNHVDPRITNILLDGRNVAKLNVCKTRDDHVPYPDGKAPFHVPQAEPADHEPEESFLGHDMYSLAMLLWLLLTEEYCRPTYAETDRIEEVRSAVARGEKPDISFLDSWKHGTKLHELLESGWSVWREGGADANTFLDQLNKLHADMD